jgi:hypothetical protein
LPCRVVTKLAAFRAATRVDRFEFEEATDAMFPVAAWVVIAVLGAVVDDVVELLLPQPATTTTTAAAVAAVPMKLLDMKFRPPVCLPQRFEQRHKEHLKKAERL